MSHSAAIVYDPGLLSYDFGPQHPLRPERITASMDLLDEAGLWFRDADTLVPAVADPGELELVHDPAYIRAVEGAASGWIPGEVLRRYGLLPGDTPAFPGMHEAASLVAGGSAEAARRILRGDVAHAFNPAGGLHHALRARASGFCVYNDPALAAAVAVEEFDARVLYVDFDCHHGDGVQWLFYHEPRVLTVSFHETGRYLFPGTGEVNEAGDGAGRGYAVNVPFAPFTQDDSWLEAIYAILPALAQRFAPDLIISAHGADTHHWDPLTHLSLTTRSFVEQARLTHELVHAYAQGRWLAVGSGGYDWSRVVPRSWAIVWSEMTGRALGEQLPTSWRARWSQSAEEPFPLQYRDAPDLSAPMPRKSEIERLNRETVQAVRATHDVIPAS